MSVKAQARYILHYYVQIWKIIERHNHSLTVPYLPPGEDATVSGSALDFKFLNTHKTPVLIVAKADPSRKLLTIALWGGTPDVKASVHHQILKITPYRVLVRCNNGLHNDETKIVFPGQYGVYVKTWTTIQTKNGSKTSNITIDKYRPSPRILERKCK